MKVDKKVPFTVEGAFFMHLLHINKGPVYQENEEITG